MERHWEEKHKKRKRELMERDEDRNERLGVSKSNFRKFSVSIWSL